MNNYPEEYVEKSTDYLMNANEAEFNNININNNNESEFHKKVDTNYSNSHDQTIDLIHPKSSNSVYSNVQKSSQQYNPSNKLNNNINNGNKPRRPINANVEENIYSINSNSSFSSNIRNNNIKGQFSNLSNVKRPPLTNQSTPYKIEDSRGRKVAKNGHDPDNAFKKVSPTRSVDNGPKIIKRELWWKEPPPSQVLIPPSSKVKVNGIGPRIDNKNPSYNPSRQNSKIIENRKLDWNKQAAVDTWGNFQHQPKDLPNEECIPPSKSNKNNADLVTQKKVLNIPNLRILNRLKN